MSKKKNLKSSNSDILKLKILLEEKSIAEEELKIGIIELTTILKEFSQKVRHDQKKSFDNFFFGKKPIDEV